MSPRIDQIIEKYYGESPQLKGLYLTHVEMVKQKALRVAAGVMRLEPDLVFIEEASMLHDIGIYRTNAPSIFCYGKANYIEHGYIGREILEKEGLPRHALVAERHTGSGISKEEIVENNMPLPMRDMLPLSLEEKIVCHADCFYSKNPGSLRVEKTVAEVREGLLAFGPGVVERFDELHRMFEDKTA